MPGQHQHRGAEAERRGARGDPFLQVQRSGDLADAGEVVLDQEAGVEAERLGLDIGLDVVVVALGGLGLGGPPRAALALPKRPKRMGDLRWGRRGGCRAGPIRPWRRVPAAMRAGGGREAGS